MSAGVVGLIIYIRVYLHLHNCVILADPEVEALRALKQQQKGLIYDGILLTNDSPRGRAQLQASKFLKVISLLQGLSSAALSC